MSIITMPSLSGFSSSRFSVQYNTQSHESPFTKTVQTLELSGARWVATYVLPPKLRADAAAWLVFLAQLRGRANRFYAGDPLGLTPRGSVPGTPLVNGASQTGSSLVTDGWTASQSNILLPGDYVAWITPTSWRELHVVTTAVNSDSSGNATISIAPPIRESPANNEALITTNPVCVMMLTDDEQAVWEERDNGQFIISFSCIEVFE